MTDPAATDASRQDPWPERTRVKNILRILKKTYPDAQCALHHKNPLQLLAAEIRSTGFYRQKAKSVKGVGEHLVARFHGKVPRTLEELVSLPGVWRKTANVVLGNCFGTPGIVVDTHVRRLSYRMGFTQETNPDKIEQDLMKWIPRSDWTKASHLITFQGRRICKALKPNCPACPIERLCPKKGPRRDMSKLASQAMSNLG